MKENDFPLNLAYHPKLDEVILNDAIRIDASFFRSLLIHKVQNDSFICAYANPEDGRFEVCQLGLKEKIRHIKLMLALKSRQLDWTESEEETTKIKSNIDLLLKYLTQFMSNKEKEAKTYTEQMETLSEYDHNLFEDIVQGFTLSGWKEEGGSPTFRLLNKNGASIKIFRNEDAPEVIKICWSAPPEVEPPISRIVEWPKKKLQDTKNRNFQISSMLHIFHYLLRKFMVRKRRQA